MEFLLHLSSTQEKFSHLPAWAPMFFNFICGFGSLTEFASWEQTLRSRSQIPGFHSHMDSVEVYQAKDNIPMGQQSSWIWLSSAGAAGR